MITPHQAHWGIVGGGMMGLSLAWRLAAAGRRVVVFEGAPEVGGLASAWTVGDVTWDRHYHVILSSDAALLDLLGELGLENDVRWTTTRTGFFAGGRLHEFSGVVDYLRFPELSIWDKMRLGLTIAAGARLSDARSLEDRTAIDWLTRWSGRRAVDRFWRPLLRAKLGGFSEEASAAFIRATIMRLHGARRRGLGPERFGAVRGGYARILGRLADRLRDAGVELRTSVDVRAVHPQGGAFEIATGTGATAYVDRVVVTLPPPLAARVCSSLEDDEQRRLERVNYLGIVCGSMVLSRPLSPYYVTNLADPSIPFTGLIDMTAVVNPEWLSDRGLMYFPRYATPADAAWNWSDEDVRMHALSTLQKVHPGNRAEVLAFQVSRARYVMALPALGYSRDLRPPMRTSIPGLYLVNSAQIQDATLNVNATIEVANRAAQELAA